MTKAQIIRTVALTTIILAVALAVDYLINVVIAPGVTPYTPLVTAAIVLLVTPAAIAYLLTQNEKMQRAQGALADERLARLAADGANAAKTQFLARMSHELRTPLNAIIGYAEIIEEDEGGPTSVADARRIQTSAHHLLNMINDILDHVKLEAGELRLMPGHTPLRPLFMEVAETIRPLAVEHGNSIEIECDETIGSAWIDARRLRQCMLNLVTNAAKFTKNGRIALRMTEDVDGAVVFEASDTGVGIAPSALTHLFQPFTQADGSITRAQDGAGLGLAVTKQLMDAMGGSISVESAAGHGSTFTLTFPRTDARSNVVSFAA